jgi:signal transduction histidine kinase
VGAGAVTAAGWQAFALVVLVVLVAGLLVAGFVVRGVRTRERERLDRWSRWVDDAVADRLPPATYDESAASSVDARLRRFLHSTRDARRRIDEEKDAITSLIGTIAHQTKTPLSNILLYAELAAEADLPAPARQHVQLVADQAQTLDALISTLVTLSYLEAGAISVHPVPCRVEEVVAAAAREIAATARARRSTVVTAPTGAWCRADAAWVREVLVNLLDNAVKYSPEGSTVTVSVEQLEVYCRIDVTDLGTGVAEEETASIFRRFYRSPRAADQPGLGIGLSLARQIVRMHDGYLRVRSVVGEGSTFSVYLPRTADPARAADPDGDVVR